MGLQQGPERRLFKRLNTRIPVQYEIFPVMSPAISSRLKKHVKTAEVENISEGGALLLMDVEIPPEQIIRFYLNLDEYSVKICAYANVRWSKYEPELQKYRVGMKFYYLKDEHRDVIKRIIKEKMN